MSLTPSRREYCIVTLYDGKRPAEQIIHDVARAERRYQEAPSESYKTHAEAWGALMIDVLADPTAPPEAVSRYREIRSELAAIYNNRTLSPAQVERASALHDEIDKLFKGE